MKKGRRGAVLGDCLRKNRVAILLWVLTAFPQADYSTRSKWPPAAAAAPGPPAFPCAGPVPAVKAPEPASAPRHTLGAESPEHRAMGAELFRMEQYVDMVLQYLRLDGGENDLVITRCDLDELIREAVRRYGPQFVLRKLSLHYEPTERTVVTDRKWFVCILEQLLSNAIKYTPEGCITIRLEGDCLRISDTGIGIAPEDLPRIFEKGYTGENGRLERTSSGLGLYLVRLILELHNASCEIKNSDTKALH